ncbi:MAG: Ig-like domain-containing protein, partial [Cystobacter sp.]
MGVASLGVKITSPADGAVVSNAHGPMISVCITDKTGNCTSGGNYRYVLNLNGVEFSGNGGSNWAHVPSPHLGGGTYSVFVKVSPAIGSGSASYTSPLVHFTVDVTAPNTSIVGSTPAPTTTERSASFSFSANDGDARFQCSLDTPSVAGDEPYDACTSPKTYSGLGDGTHTFLVRAVDAAGNVDPTPATYSWTVAPLKTRITQAPPSSTPSPVASFEFGALGAMRYECALDAPGSYQDEPFTPCASPKNYSNLSEGAYVFSVRAMDLHGNSEAEPVTHSWSVDSSRPDVRIDSGPPKWSRVKTAEFRFSSTRNDVFFECELDGHPVLPCRSPVALAVQEDEGEHAFSVRAVNGSGKKSATESFSWCVDTSPPVVRIVSPFDQEVVTLLAPNFTGTVDDPDSTVKVSVDDVEVGETTADAKGKWFLRLSRELTSGPHTARARAINRVGSEGRSGIQRFSVDASLPDTRILRSPPRIDESRVATFEFESSEGGTQFQCRLDQAQTFSPCEQLQSFQELAEGDHTLQVRAVDDEGNLDPTPEIYQWTIVAPVPPPEIVEPARDATVDTRTPTIVGRGTPGGDVMLFIDGQVFAVVRTDASGTWTLPLSTPLEEGEHRLSVEATDKLGNPRGQRSVEHPIFIRLVSEEGHVIGGGLGCASSGPSSSAWGLLGSAAWLLWR